MRIEESELPPCVTAANWKSERKGGVRHVLSNDLPIPYRRSDACLRRRESGWPVDRGAKYYGGTISKAMVPKDDISVFAAAKKWLDQYFSGKSHPFRNCRWRPSAVNFARACGVFYAKSLTARCSPMVISQNGWPHSWEGNGCPAKR